MSSIHNNIIDRSSNGEAQLFYALVRTSLSSSEAHYDGQKIMVMVKASLMAKASFSKLEWNETGLK